MENLDANMIDFWLTFVSDRVDMEQLTIVLATVGVLYNAVR